MGRSQGDVSNFGPRKFHHSKSSAYWCDQQTRRRSACGLHLRQSSASWLNEQVCYTLVDCNPLTPLLRFVLDLYKLFLDCCAELLGVIGRGSISSYNDDWSLYTTTSIVKYCIRRNLYMFILSHFIRFYVVLNCCSWYLNYHVAEDWVLYRHFICIRFFTTQVDIYKHKMKKYRENTIYRNT